MKKLLKLALVVMFSASVLLVAKAADLNSNATELESYDHHELAPKLALFSPKNDGSYTIVMNQWEGYKEPGYFGYNRLNFTNLTDQVRIEESDLDITQPGTYTIRYILTSNGHTTKAKRNVIVESASKPAGWTHPHPNGIPGFNSPSSNSTTGTGSGSTSGSGSSSSNNDKLVADLQEQIKDLQQQLEEAKKLCEK